MKFLYLLIISNKLSKYCKYTVCTSQVLDRTSTVDSVEYYNSLLVQSSTFMNITIFIKYTPERDIIVNFLNLGGSSPQALMMLRLWKQLNTWCMGGARVFILVRPILRKVKWHFKSIISNVSCHNLVIFKLMKFC